MLAEIVTVRRCCVASIVAAGAFVRLPEPAKALPPPPPTFHVVPLLGDPVADDPRCVPFLPEIVRHPNWSLVFARGWSGCLGSRVEDSFDVDSSGTVHWSKPGLPTRTLVLEREELARLTNIAASDCQFAEHGYYVGWYRVAVGNDPDANGGATIAQQSPAGAVLDDLFDAAIARHDRMYLAGVGAVDLRATIYRGLKLRLRDHHLTVSNSRRIVYRSDLTDRELSDLVARFFDHPQTADPEAEGELYAGGHHLAVSISSWALPENDPLGYAIRSSYEVSSDDR